MKRRDFLRNTLMLGTSGLLPGTGFAATCGLLNAEPLEPIWNAAKGGRWNIVKEWLTLDPSLIHVRGDAMAIDSASVCPLNVYDGTVYHLAAAQAYDTNLLKYLISKGADIHAKDREGRTALNFAAAVNRKLEILKFIISQGDNLINGSEGSYNVPMSYILSRGDVETLQYFLSIGGDLGTERSSYRVSIESIMYNLNRMDMLEYLLDRVVPVNAKFGRDEMTLLHYAVNFCYRSDIEVVKYLVSRGADVNQKNRDGDTSLHKALSSLSSVLGRERFDDYLAALGERDRSGSRQESKQCREKIYQIVKYLVSQGADINAKNHRGLTPMHDAAGVSKECLEYLVSQGGDIHATTDWGRTLVERKCVR